MRLRYKQPTAETSQLLEYPIRKDSVVPAGKLSPDFRFAASVAAFGQLLRGGEHVGDFGFEDVATLAKGALAQDEEGYRREFVSLVKLAQALQPRRPAAGAGRTECRGSVRGQVGSAVARGQAAMLEYA